ncbi:hypothetical protein CSE16_07715 [Solibacillus sp. R5-41]|uniref:DUF4183 domain-containing protein n=1 Tax=Solibacillus sp. R5-41 TaxID=2048654 RepID=UPI000C124D15|nr:DUF4183 domain-containing protein [Solibacillus sp. R5-41]ATP39946.1 hypothetical protein CSE16_07715 [Solibacillus sp. R5-41]
MNEVNPPKMEYNDCSDENRFYWPPIKAIEKSHIPSPPVIVPGGTIIPTINRYFYIAPQNISLTNGVTLPANLFSDDNGNSVTAFKIFNPNGYVNLYINAMMQEGSIYTVTPTSLILPPNNATIFARTPIIIESLGFTMDSG